ncbi:unnamed protein product [Heterobilharzia americana]|nr:unnamed protein product [Heterobilharzia americana]CAH8434348.1 unnamed protein product [Heterobilharzia americana]
MVDLQLNREAIAEHNRLRALHGCPPITYDESLARDAQKWAENLSRIRTLKHSISDYYGENLASAMSSSLAEMNGVQATQRWYDEIKYHNFQGQFSSQSGHFTQVVWKSTRRAGFGIKHTDDGKHVYIVGRYAPRGNVNGQFIENVPRPIWRQSKRNSQIFQQNNGLANSNAIKQRNQNGITIQREYNNANNVTTRPVKIIRISENRQPEEIRRVPRNGSGEMKIIHETENRNPRQTEYTVRTLRSRERKRTKKCSIL